MIACPKCGQPTTVLETRSTGPARVRRRRRCDSVSCGAKVTTIEIPIADATKGHQQLVLAPRRLIEAAYAVLGDALGKSEIVEADTMEEPC